ncbi:MAG: hypothetical protein AABW45_02910 [Nanoarchaeota archaeon]
MNQNRNKLIDLFIGNISNAIIHKILENAIKDENIRLRYEKELTNSMEIALSYRHKINPVNIKLPEKDVNYIKGKIIKRVKAELKSRINKGYKGIELNSIEIIMERILKQTKVI